MSLTSTSFGRTSRAFLLSIGIGMAALTMAVVGPEFIGPPQASAEEPYVTRWAAGGPDDEEEVVLEWYDPDTGEYWIEVYYKDGRHSIFYDNPNPEGGDNDGKGDIDMALDLLKQKGGGMMGPTWQDTPLGAILSNAGKAIGPFHNPADDGEGGMSPTGSISFKSPKDLAEEAYEGAGGIGGFDFDGNGGSAGSQIAAMIRSGKKGAGHGDHGDDDKPRGGNFFDDSMPGPPELVNPAWSADDWQAYFELQLMIDEMNVEN